MAELTIDEMKEHKIMRLLLKIKNGTPPVRKTALRQDIRIDGVLNRLLTPGVGAYLGA